MAPPPPPPPPFYTLALSHLPHLKYGTSSVNYMHHWLYSWQLTFEYCKIMFFFLFRLLSDYVSKLPEDSGDLKNTSGMLIVVDSLNQN